MTRSELNTNKSTVTLHVVSSLDGFIAKNDNSVSWLDTSGEVYEKGVSEGSAEEVTSAIDCYVLGSRREKHCCGTELEVELVTRLMLETGAWI